MKKGKKILALIIGLGLIVGISAACKSGSGASSSGKITLDNVRDYVVGLDEEMKLESGGKKAVTNFDNAATTPALQPVMDVVDEELKKYGSIGRGF